MQVPICVISFLAQIWCLVAGTDYKISQFGKPVGRTFNYKILCEDQKLEDIKIWIRFNGDSASDRSTSLDKNCKLKSNFEDSPYFSSSDVSEAIFSITFTQKMNGKNFTVFIRKNTKEDIQLFSQTIVLGKKNKINNEVPFADQGGDSKCKNLDNCEELYGKIPNIKQCEEDEWFQINCKKYCGLCNDYPDSNMGPKAPSKNDHGPEIAPKTRSKNSEDKSKKENEKPFAVASTTTETTTIKMNKKGDKEGSEKGKSGSILKPMAILYMMITVFGTFIGYV